MNATTRVAWLRAINVSGHNKLPMAELRALFEDLGFARVRSYIQSGNVVFDSSTGDDLEPALEAAILERFGLTVPVMIRTRAELDAVIRANPFSCEAADDPRKVHVAFLSACPAPAAIAELGTLALGDDRAQVIGRELYLHCPNGIGRTRLTNPRVEKLLGIRATARNWRTVNRMLSMANESSR